jgi:hypothetical protein
MKKDLNKDINRGYLYFIGRITKNKKGFYSFFKLMFFRATDLLRVALIPFALLYATILIIILNLRLFFSRKASSRDLHSRALDYVPQFILQYPLHLYPVVSKSLEMAFLKEHLPLYEDGKSIIEMAIGDGSFSKRIFSNEAGIVAFDLNPYSLIQTNRLAHISRRIVADCMNPPILSGSAHLLLSNNFLHHVSNKDYVLHNWAKVSHYAIFNENTPYWGSGWAMPFLFKLIGMKSFSKRISDNLAKRSLQALLPADGLRKMVNSCFEILDERTFFDEKTFFLCSIFSSFLLCKGPPTPKIPKLIFNKFMRPLIYNLTYLTARALIRYDAIQSRKRDAYIFWECKSREYDMKKRSRIQLACPDCGNAIQGNKCLICEKEFTECEGMLFLVPDEIRSKVVFNKANADYLGEEHL